MAAGSRRASALYLVMAVLAAIWLALDAAGASVVMAAPSLAWWEHAASLTEWMRNPASPGNPHLAVATPGLLYNPWLWLLAKAGLLTGFDAPTLLALGNLIGFGVFALGVYAFMRAYFGDHRAPLVGLVVVLFFWGAAGPAGDPYQYRQLFYSAGLSPAIAFGLSLNLLAGAIVLLRSPAYALLGTPLFVGLAALVVLIDPLTALFAFIGALLLALTEPATSMARRFVILLGVAGGIALTLLWPWFPYWPLLQSAPASGIHWLAIIGGAVDEFPPVDWYSLRYLVIALGPALLGVPMLLWFLLRRQHGFIVLGALLMAVPLAINAFSPLPAVPRFAVFTVFYLHLAVIWLGLAALDAARGLPRRPLATLGVLLALAVGGIATATNLLLTALEFDSQTIRAPEPVPVARTGRPVGVAEPVAVYRQLAAALPANAAVFAPAELGWPLPAFQGKVVSVLQPNPLLDDGEARYRATGDFFYRPITAAQRQALLQQYRGTHVLFSATDPGINSSLLAWLTAQADAVAVAGPLRLYAIRGAVYPEATAPPPPAPAAPSPRVPRRPPEPAAEPPQPVLEPQPEHAEPTSQPRSFGVPIGEPLLPVPDEGE